MTEEEENLFQKSINCWICKKFISNHEDKVRDHCHVTGKFRGAAHESCNLNFQYSVIQGQFSPLLEGKKIPP